MKKRRGIASLLELIVASIICSFIILMLISLIRLAGHWPVKSNSYLYGIQDMCLLLETMEMDVKSADEILATGDILELTAEDTWIIYEVNGKEILRNNECMLKNIRTASMMPLGKNAVELIIEFWDGKAISISMHQ